MNDVVAEQQGNAHAGLLDGDTLQLAVVGRDVGIEDVSTGAVADRLFDVFRKRRSGCGEVARVEN